MAEATQRMEDEFFKDLGGSTMDDETTFTEDSVPFNVNDGIDIGDFSDVRRDIMPAVSKCQGQIRRAAVAANKAGDVKRIKLEICLTGGVNINGETKYVNRILFTAANQLIFWASPEKSQSSDYYRGKKHLLDFKTFCTKGLGLDMTQVQKQFSKSPDEFCQSITGRMIGFDIKHEESRELIDGQWINTGELQEKITNWRKAAEE